MDFSKFARQIAVSGIGIEGQLKLERARVLIVGMGALGCPASLYLAAAGLGSISICDGDIIELSNLHRQILYGPDDIAKPKVKVAHARLQKQFPDCEIKPIFDYMSAENARSMLKDIDLILDCTDRFSSRFLLHDLACKNKINLISSAVQGFSGSLLYLPFNDPDFHGCLRCLWKQAPQDGATGACSTTGILGASAGVLALLETHMAINTILGGSGLQALCDYRVNLRTLSISKLFWEPRSDCVCQASEEVQREGAEHKRVELARTPPRNLPGLEAPICYIDIRARQEKQDIDEFLFANIRDYSTEEIINDTSLLPRAGTVVFLCEYGVVSENFARYLRSLQVIESKVLLSSWPGGFARMRAALHTLPKF